MTTTAQIQQHYDNIAALNQAIQQEFACIKRLELQKGKVKSGVGERAVVELQIREAKKKMKAV